MKTFAAKPLLVFVRRKLRRELRQFSGSLDVFASTRTKSSENFSLQKKIGSERV